MNGKLVLSVFPGIDLLGKAFEECGFCVVRGPDLLWGGDIRDFHPPTGVFFGVLGGPPCQDFSGLRRCDPTGYGDEMLGEFVRVTGESQPEWWLMENVARVPNLVVPGYVTQRFDMNQAWYENVSRLRHIQFGSLSGRLINVSRHKATGNPEPLALAHDSRSFKDVCRLQGLPHDFDLPPFKAAEKIKAVGNGVPLAMGRVLAQAVSQAYATDESHFPLQSQLFDSNMVPVGRCACGCGRPVSGKALYYSSTCRKRAQRKRDRPG